MKPTIIKFGMIAIALSCIILYILFWITQPYLMLLLHIFCVVGVVLLFMEDNIKETEDNEDLNEYYKLEDTYGKN